jgi:hypothetical protein
VDVCGIKDWQYAHGIKTTSLITVSFAGATIGSGGATSEKSVPLHIGQRSDLIRPSIDVPKFFLPYTLR